MRVLGMMNTLRRVVPNVRNDGAMMAFETQEVFYQAQRFRAINGDFTEEEKRLLLPEIRRTKKTLVDAIPQMTAKLYSLETVKVKRSGLEHLIENFPEELGDLKNSESLKTFDSELTKAIEKISKNKNHIDYLQTPFS